jgi:hypothetical protein
MWSTGGGNRDVEAASSTLGMLREPGGVSVVLAVSASVHAAQLADGATEEEK